MSFDYPLKFASSHYGELINNIFKHIHPVDYSDWENRRVMTMMELAYLSAGFEPYHTGSLDSLIIELKEALHNLDSNELRLNALRLDHAIVDKFAKFNRAYAGRDGLDVYEKILSNANHLLSYADVISREALLINEDERRLYSINKPDDTEVWRTGFLISWAKALPGFELPDEIENFDNLYEFEKTTAVQKLSTLENDVLYYEGWLNLNAVGAPKLAALAHAYVEEERLVAADNNRKFSTGNMAKYIEKNYEIINRNKNIHESLKKLSEVASKTPSGFSLKKKVTKK